MSDEFDERVKGLFPCCEDYRLVKCHSLVCPGDQYHKAVAAALREAYHKGVDDMTRRAIEVDNREVADLRAERDEARAMLSLCNSNDYARAAQIIDLRAENEQLSAANEFLKRCFDERETALGQAYAEIDQLKAQLEKLRQFAATYDCHCVENYPGTTAYHGHDCENAVVQEFVEQWMARAAMEKKP